MGKADSAACPFRIALRRTLRHRRQWHALLSDHTTTIAATIRLPQYRHRRARFTPPGRRVDWGQRAIGLAARRHGADRIRTFRRAWTAGPRLPDGGADFVVTKRQGESPMAAPLNRQVKLAARP